MAQFLSLNSLCDLKQRDVYLPRVIPGQTHTVAVRKRCKCTVSIVGVISLYYVPTCCTTSFVNRKPLLPGLCIVNI